MEIKLVVKDWRKQQTKNLSWSVERCRQTFFEVTSQMIKRIVSGGFRFSASIIKKEIARISIQMPKMTNYLWSPKQVNATTLMAQCSVCLFQNRRMWLCKCAISLRLALSEHRFATNQLEITSPVNAAWFGTEEAVFFGAGCFSSGNFQSKE